MRIVLLVLFLGLLVAGCTHKQPNFPATGVAGTSKPEPGTPPGKQKFIVTLENGLAGKVLKVDQAGRFVVVNFPIGHLPAKDQRLNVYRLGLKVGEIRITGPQLDDKIIGDLAVGDARVGDEVRDR